MVIWLHQISNTRRSLIVKSWAKFWDQLRQRIIMRTCPRQPLLSIHHKHLPDHHRQYRIITKIIITTTNTFTPIIWTHSSSPRKTRVCISASTQTHRIMSCEMLPFWLNVRFLKFTFKIYYLVESHELKIFFLILGNSATNRRRITNSIEQLVLFTLSYCLSYYMFFSRREFF